MAASTKDKPPSAITAWETASGKAITCGTDDDVRIALDRMGQGKVRRLPVVDDDGILQGIFSINDVVLTAGKHRGRSAAAVLAEEVIGTLQDICAHRARAGV